MKKIIFVMPQLKTGGGLRVCTEISNLLVKEFDVRFVLPNSSDDCTFVIDKKIKIEKIGANRDTKFGKIQNILKMFSHLRKNYSKDIIITTDPIISIFFTFYKFKHLYRYVQADDYQIFDDLMLLKNRSFLTIYKLLTKLSYKMQINYLFNSTYTYERFIEVSGKTVPKKIVHPAVDKSIFYDFNKREKRDRLNISLVGRKHPLKGLSDFISVWSEIKRVKELRDRVGEIYIITHDDLSQFDLTNFTVINPKSDQEIANIYNQSDIFISTSWQEGFSLPPLEAMSCGCALLVSNSGGINEYAYPGFNALIYQAKDKTALKKALIELLFDTALVTKLQKNGQNIAKEFSWENSTKQFIKQLK